MERNRVRQGALIGVVVLAAAALAGCTVRVAAGNHSSGSPTMSDDGLSVVFTSFASDLVPGDDNGNYDIFFKDRSTGALIQVTEGNSDSYFPQVSANGAFVVFKSFATDLVAGDSLAPDLFLWERATGTTTKITAGAGVESEFSFSGDGRYVAYAAWDSPIVPGDTNEMTDVLVWDRTTGVTTRITGGQPGDVGGSWLPSISADGGRVAFTSESIGVIPGDNRPGRNVFVWDRATGATTRITGFTAGAFSQSPEISADGDHVVFYSTEHLAPGDDVLGTDIHVWDRGPGTVTLLPPSNGTLSFEPAISNDGRYVAYRGTGSLLLWDRTTGTTSPVVTGDSFNSPDLSPDGNLMIFSSNSTDLVPGADPNGIYSDIFLWARDPG